MPVRPRTGIGAPTYHASDSRRYCFELSRSSALLSRGLLEFQALKECQTLVQARLAGAPGAEVWTWPLEFIMLARSKLGHEAERKLKQHQRNHEQHDIKQ